MMATMQCFASCEADSGSFNTKWVHVATACIGLFEESSHAIVFSEELGVFNAITSLLPCSETGMQ